MSATTVHADSVDRALESLARELGADAVSDRAQIDLTEFADPYRTSHNEGNPPVGVVFPTTTEQVQAVLRIAGEFGVPLWAHSTGRNYGYGGAEPRVPGSIALSMRRMNRIIDIDDEHGVAVVEPGVTFFDLHNALGSGGHRWVYSVPDLGWGSLIGNALDHGIGYTSAGEHADNLCGLEVVLATGDVIRTGTGAMTGTPNAHLHRRGFGPSLDGLFGQSNFGVVTRAGVWLTPEPEVFLSAEVTAPREEDLGELVEVLRPLMLEGTITAFPLIAHGFGAIAARLPKEQWQHLRGPGTSEQLSELLAPLGMSMWTVRLPLAGRRATVAAQRLIIEDSLRAVPGVKVEFAEFEPPYNAHTVAPQSLVAAGVPNMGLLQILDAWGGHNGTAGHKDFSPAIPFTGRAALAAHRTVHGRLREDDVPAASAYALRRRGIINVNMMMYDRSDVQAADRVNRTYEALRQELASQGYGLYRTHIDHADDVASGYDFDGNSLSRVLGRIKGALDPAGVLSPGKQGIWPTAPTHQKEDS